MNRSAAIKGFTTIELIVVMAIFSLFLAISLPMFRHAAGEGEQDIDRLSDLVMSLKHKSQAEEKTYVLHLSLSAGTIWATHSGMTQDQGREARNSGVRLSKDCELVDVVFPISFGEAQGPEYQIRFYAKGYSDPAIIRLRVHGAPVALRIEPFLQRPSRSSKDDYACS